MPLFGKRRREPSTSSASSSSSCSRGANRQSPPAPNQNPVVIRGMRVVDQTRRDVLSTPSIPSSDPRFRLALFAYDTGLAMLESPRGKHALFETARDVVAALGRKAKKEAVFKTDTEIPEESRLSVFMSTFLSRCRSSPPNITISNRVVGDGYTRRLDWCLHLGKQRAVYDPKYGALYHLDSRLINNALHIARMKQYKEEFQKYLFLLSVTVAHELVHLFVGMLLGNSEFDTPGAINFPTVSSLSTEGESGRVWESLFFEGYNIVPYEDRRHELGILQAGIFCARARDGQAAPVDQNWMLQMLQLDFSRSIKLLEPVRRIGRSVRTMGEVRPYAGLEDYPRSDLSEYVMSVNALNSYEIRAENVQALRVMLHHPEVAVASQV